MHWENSNLYLSLRITAFGNKGSLECLATYWEWQSPLLSEAHLPSFCFSPVSVLPIFVPQTLLFPHPNGCCSSYCLWHLSPLQHYHQRCPTLLEGTHKEIQQRQWFWFFTFPSSATFNIVFCPKTNLALVSSLAKSELLAIWPISIPNTGPSDLLSQASCL